MASRLILIGFMGSGKSVVGKRLAGDLGWRFIDADKLVERELGMSISEAFRSRGEAQFRKTEEAVVLSLLGPGDKDEVISLGGGAVTSNPVFQQLSREPLVIFLDQDLDTAYRRAQDGKRPLARDRKGFEELFYMREERYRNAADIVVETREKNVTQIADEIAAIVRGRMGVA